MPQRPGEEPSSSNHAQERVNEFLRERGLDPDDSAPPEPADADPTVSEDGDVGPDTEEDPRAASDPGPPDPRPTVPEPGDTDWAAAPEAGNDA
jgi:hypothetical protein